eukprot:4943606-Karenia_brevis.AAC.1
MVPHTVCTGVIRRYVVPAGIHTYRPEDPKPKLIQEYMDCQWRNEETTLLAYLRTSTQNGDERKSKRRVLVATI